MTKQPSDNLQPLTLILIMALLGSGFAARAFGESEAIAIGQLTDDLGFAPTRAGIIISIQNIAAGLIGLLIAPFMGVLQRRTIAGIGFSLISFGVAVSVIFNDYSLVMIGRTFVGLGIGLTIAGSSAAYASLREPDRASGTVMVIGSLLGGLCLGVMPWVGVNYGLDGTYLLQAAFALFLAPFFWFLPNAARTDKTKPESRGRLGLGFVTLPAVAVLASVMFLFLGESTAWMLAEQRGKALNLSPERIGLWLGIHAALGVAGAGLVALFGTRFGRFMPWTIGMAVLIIGIGLAHWVDAEWAYVIGLFMWSVGFFFMFPYFTGALAVIDPEGRLNTLKAALISISAASGPTIAGYMREEIGIDRVAPFSMILLLMTIVLCAPVLFRQDRQSDHG